MFAAFALAALAIVVVPFASHAAGSDVAEPNRWSEARVASYVQQGHPVFVYFTADWCLSCKVNEATSIDRDEVRDAFKQGRREGARRRLDQRRPVDHPVPGKPGQGGRAALLYGTRPASRRNNCRRCSRQQCLFPALGRCRPARNGAPRFLARDRSLENLRPCKFLRADLGRIAVDNDEIRPFPRLQRSDLVFREPRVSGSASLRRQRLFKG